MDLRKLVGGNYDTSAPMEGVIHSVPSNDTGALRRTNTDVGRPPSASRSRPGAPPSSSRSFWSTVLDRPHQPSSSSSSHAGSSSSSSSAARGSASSTRTSIASMSFRLSDAPVSSTPARASSTASPYPLRMQSFHSSSGRSSHHAQQSAGPPMCPTCNKQYASLSQLQAHVRKHHRNRERERDPSARAAASAAAAAAAAAAASGKFQCPSCSHQFSQRSHLNQHLKTVHAGIRPHTCPVADCAKAFGKRSDLKSHISSVHENARPFACEFCDKRFAKKSNLSRHRENLHREKVESLRR